MSFEKKQSFTKERIEEILDNQEYSKLYCPKCRSDKIREKSGMFVSLYTCENCGHEFREFEINNLQS